MRVVAFVAVSVAVVISQVEGSSSSDVQPVRKFNSIYQNVHFILNKALDCEDKVKWELMNLAAVKLNDFQGCVNATRALADLQVDFYDLWQFTKHLVSFIANLISSVKDCGKQYYPNPFNILNCTVSVLKNSGPDLSDLLSELKELGNGTGTTIYAIIRYIKECVSFHSSELLIEATDIITNRCLDRPIKQSKIYSRLRLK